MPYDAFISYAARDHAFAERLYDRLCDADLNVWFDKARLEPGFDWYSEIEQGCENSRVVLPVLTPRWQSSEWTKYETYGAETVIPLVFEGTWEEVCTPPLEKYQAETIDCRSVESMDLRRLLSALKRAIALPAPDKASRITHMHHRANDYFIGREAELVRIHEEFHRNPRAALTQGRVRVIAAMGGAGKTTLARHYAEKYWRCYPEMFWVDCRMGLETEFARLYNVMYPDDPGSNKTDAQRAEHALQALNGRETRLLILDNAEDEQSVMQWIPKTGGCHTLITSRFSGWSSAIRTVHLYLLEKGPAVEFLQRRSGTPAIDDELPACETLAEKLGYLPLALEQAAAYIEQQGEWFLFSDYLKLFERATRELLELGALGSTEYPDSVATTWQSSIKMLTPPARTVLRLSSFLASTPLPVEFLVDNGAALLEQTRAFNGDRAPDIPTDWEFWIRNALGLLNRYSLIRLDGIAYSLHPLLQTVERFNVSASESPVWVSACFEMLKKHAPAYADRPDTWNAWDGLFPHAQALYGHADNLTAEQAIALLDALARYKFGKARYDESLRFEREAFERAASEYGTDAEETNDRLLNLGESLRSSNRFDEAEDVFRRALSWEEEHNGHDHRNVANCLNYLGLLLRVKGDIDEAEKCFSEGLAICDRIELKSGRAYVKLLLNLAYIRVNSKNSEAEELGRRSLAQSESEFGEQDLLTLYSASVVATAVNNQGRHADAEPFMAKAAAGLTGLLGDEHPEALGTLEAHAIVLGNLGRWTEAIPLRERALRARASTLGELAEGTLEAAHELAKAHLYAGEIVEGRALCRTVLKQREEVLEENAPAVLASLTLLINSFGDDQESDEAIALRRRLVEASLTSADDRQKEALALEINNLSVSLRKKGQLVEAESLAQRALELEEAVRDADHPKIAHRLTNHSMLLIAIGKIDDAGKQLARGWRLKESAHDLTSARILFLQLSIAYVNGQSPDKPIERLKRLLSAGELPDHANVVRTWDVSCVIDYLKERIPAERMDFMIALSETLSDASTVSSLDRFPDWQRAPTERESPNKDKRNTSE